MILCTNGGMDIFVQHVSYISICMIFRPQRNAAA